jgi:trk system potassium uptake protein
MIRKRIAIIGMGGFGKVLAERLYLEGHEVLAIDNRIEEIEEIKDKCTAAVCLDATDENALRSQGLEDMDVAVISVAESFETLVVCADILKGLGVKEIYARYKTDLHKKILRMIGVQHIFNPEEKAAINMAEALRHQGIFTNLFLSEDYRIADIMVPEGIVGKSIAELEIREKYFLNIVTIKRKKRNEKQKRQTDEEKEVILGIPQDTDRFRANDIIVVFGKQSDINKFLEM